MSKLTIIGGEKLFGRINIQSAKNSVVSLIASSILCNGKIILKKVKCLSDVVNMCAILEKMGAKTYFKEGDLFLNCSSLYSYVPDSNLSKTLRSSFFMTGALLSRFKKAEMSFPGGCKIGARPINIHLQGLKRLGVKVKTENSKIFLDGENMRSSVIDLPYPSVGATVNLITASVFLGGETVIRNCAREPEIIDLQNFLNLIGFKVFGAGESEIRVQGVKSVDCGEIVYTPVEDRIEAGTYLLATLACGGQVELNNIYIKNIYSLYEKIYENDCKIVAENGKITINARGGGKSLGKVTTGPFPDFPTDLQAPLCAYACSLRGETEICENVFEKRFSHIDELVKMGAIIKRGERQVVITGGKLSGANVYACDLRAGAGLVLAGLIAGGTTVLDGVEIIDRGYFEIEKILTSLGAKVERI